MEYARDWCIHGYHVYREICLAATGEILVCTCKFWPQIVGLYYTYGPHSPLNAVRMASTSRFAAAIAWGGIEDDSEPLGSGRPYFLVITMIHSLTNLASSKHA